ncbi:MAG: hypothetical protein KDK90_17615 [Leptospiraceae bacterium]|nr:hypothetical protein [Leptospiraceae bacterium]
MPQSKKKFGIPPVWNTFADVNNDGKTDFVWYNNGKDGRVDLVRGTIEQENNTEYKKVESNGSETYRVSTFSFEHLYHGKLHSISGGYAQKFEIAYKLAPLPSVSSTRNYPNLPYPYPNYVVSKVTLKHNDTVVGNNQYTYSENRFYVSPNPEETKSLGFSTITKLVTVGIQKSKDVNTFSQDYDIAGSLINQKHYVYEKKEGTETEQITHQKDIQYEKVTHNKADWVRKKSFTEYHYTEDTSNPLVTKNTTITYSDGNVTKREISITQKTQSGITQESFVETLEMTNYNAYGKPRNIIKKSGGQILEKVEYIINSKNNVKEKKLSVSSSEGDAITSYTYDGHGNVETKTDPRGNVTTYVYDTDVHTFPTEVKNTYKGTVYTIKMDYNTLNGKLLSQTDASGVSTHIDYDSYGRKLKVWYPGNPKEPNNYNEEFVYVDTEDEHSAMRILKDSSSSGLWYKEYRDNWDRVYKTETKAKEGILSDTVFTEEMEYYGNRELLKKKSIPYIVESDRKCLASPVHYDKKSRLEPIHQACRDDKNTKGRNMKILTTLLLILLVQCKYTGGYDIVKGSKAIKEIKEKILSYSSIGTLYTVVSASNFTCPSSSTAKIITETEPNNTFKYANQIDFPTEEQSVRFQGTVTVGNSDYDIFYMIVPSDTTYSKLYHKGDAPCSILIYSDGSELNNDSSNPVSDNTRYVGDISKYGDSQDIQPSEYIFFFCNTVKDNRSYDAEISLTSLGSSSSSTNISSSFSSTESLLSSSTLGPTVFEISSGIGKSKYYTQSSLDKCLKRLKKKVPAASLLDSYNYLLYLNCGASSYTPINPYFVAGYECELQEADWIQIGDLGIP